MPELREHFLAHVLVVALVGSVVAGIPAAVVERLDMLVMAVRVLELPVVLDQAAMPLVVLVAAVAVVGMAQFGFPVVVWRQAALVAGAASASMDKAQMVQEAETQEPIRHRITLPEAVVAQAELTEAVQAVITAGLAVFMGAAAALCTTAPQMARALEALSGLFGRAALAALHPSLLQT